MPGATLAGLPAGVQTSLPLPCSMHTPLPVLPGSVNSDQQWRFTKFTVACPVAMAIVMAWTGGEVGWRCIGAGRPPGWGRTPAPNATLLCTKGNGLIEAQNWS